MMQRQAPERAVGHLTAVWLIGCALTHLQSQAVLIALFADGPGLFGVVVVGGGVVVGAVAVLAWLGSAARTLVPLLRRTHGRWAWAAGVYTLGTAGACGAAAVRFEIDHLENGLLLYLAGGTCYALAAALFLEGLRVRMGALGAASALTIGGMYAAWAAGQPPTLDEWITANGVDRILLRVGDPPPGYALNVMGASADGFGVDYEGPNSARVHLHVAPAGHDTRRVDARGCPVPFGDPIRCTDDGGGRQLVTFVGSYEHQELRLRRDALVYTVTVEGSRTDLSAARHILSTLRPATDTELTGLLELPIPR
ncbi:hypothetical protein P1P75_02900 [Streptomyces sp. ID05-39B]|uniref:hypothetical protein n=1 Tax=Streptomyces sp. ID05-39B TaxID=3028664 RepID=UPI00299FD9CA|nr:hypothetical protein [Streptomyces sp. ID05-39B]MDX3525410.1 hypothetical protein [Streptomyces sp. ID05-39B]